MNDDHNMFSMISGLIAHGMLIDIVAHLGRVHAGIRGSLCSII